MAGYQIHEELGPKTRALLLEHEAQHADDRHSAIAAPILDEVYRAGDLPAGSVVSAGAGNSQQYVVGASGRCMRWEQPIPGSENWRLNYAGRLAGHGQDLPDDDGRWMTPRERAEVDESRRRPQP